LHVVLATSGTAIPGVDINALPKTVNIPAGVRSANIDVKATTADSGVKRIKIKLQSGPGYLVSTNAQLSKTAVKIWAQQ
jgi:hypothetical protein